MTVQIMEAIRDRSNKQADIARLYRQAMAESFSSTDWPAVNEAIRIRWSRSGLLRVKGMVWKMIYSR